jgi:hypothetical protein
MLAVLDTQPLVAQEVGSMIRPAQKPEPRDQRHRLRHSACHNPWLSVVLMRWGRASTSSYHRDTAVIERRHVLLGANTIIVCITIDIMGVVLVFIAGHLCCRSDEATQTAGAGRKSNYSKCRKIVIMGLVFNIGYNIYGV